MANHKQAIKRNRQRINRQTHHRHFKTTMRTSVKRVRSAVEGNDKAAAAEALVKAVPLIDRCAQQGIIPRQRAARMVSRLTMAVNGIA